MLDKVEINNKFMSKQVAFYYAGAVDCEIVVLLYDSTLGSELLFYPKFHLENMFLFSKFVI